MFDGAKQVPAVASTLGGTTMVTLANLYTILDVSIQQLAFGLAILPLLVALAWYVSHPVHRRQLLATGGSDARRDGRVVNGAADPVGVSVGRIVPPSGATPRRVRGLPSMALAPK
jgi:hypothetical protein